MLRNNTKRVVLVVQTRENNAFCDVSRGRARLPGPKSIKESYSTTRFVWKNIDFMVFSAHDTRQNAHFGRKNKAKLCKTCSFGFANPRKRYVLPHKNLVFGWGVVVPRQKRAMAPVSVTLTRYAGGAKELSGAS